MNIAARIKITPAADRRGAPRRKLSLALAMRGAGKEAIIHDLSSTGMLIETATELAPFDELEFELPETGNRRALVIWSSGRFYGCEFEYPLPQAAISASLLLSSPLQRIEAPSSLPPEPPTRSIAETPATVDLVPSTSIDEARAPLGTRLRVIFGSAIILWAFIIWTITWLIRLIGSRIH